MSTNTSTVDFIPATASTVSPTTTESHFLSLSPVECARATLALMEAHNVRIGHAVKNGGTVILTHDGPQVVQTMIDFLNNWANEIMPDPKTAPAVYAAMAVVQRILEERKYRAVAASSSIPRSLKPMTLSGRKK